MSASRSRRWIGLVFAVCLTSVLLSVASPARAEDTTPPQILSFSLTPSEVNTESGDQTVTATMRLTDDLAGVNTSSDGLSGETCWVYMKAMVGTQSFWIDMKRTSGDDRDGIYSGTGVIRKGSKEGVWSVTDMRLWFVASLRFWMGPRAGDRVKGMGLTYVARRSGDGWTLDDGDVLAG